MKLSASEQNEQNSPKQATDYRLGNNNGLIVHIQTADEEEWYNMSQIQKVNVSGIMCKACTGYFQVTRSNVKSF